MDALPKVSPELIEYLERIYPDRLPSLGTPEKEIWYEVGRVAVVRHLRSIFDEQNQTVLKGDN